MFAKYTYLCSPVWGWRIAAAMAEEPRKPYLNPKVQKRKKEYLFMRYQHVFQKYACLSAERTANDGPIWVCWWQGEEKMPPLIKGCYNRLLDMKPADRDVIFISEDNFRNYADIPEFVLQKLHRGKLSITQFSDILRFCLLLKHGGLWIDATTWVTSPMKPEIFKGSFYTCRSTDPDIVDTKRVARGKDTPWLLGSCSGSPIFAICRDIFFDQWKRYSLAYDYLLIDYCLILIYDNIPALREEMDAGADVQNHLFAMEPLLNKPFDEEHFEELSRQTPFFKLSCKLGGKPLTDNGELTYFGHFCQYQRKGDSPKDWCAPRT